MRMIHPVLLVVLLILTPAIAATAEKIYWVTTDGVTEYDTDYFANRPKAGPDSVLVAHGITFNITYQDGTSNVGFGTAATDSALRRARFEDALTYVASIIQETGTLDIDVDNSLQNGSSGLLAKAGPFYSDAPQFQNGTAFDRLDTGVKPFAGTPEIQVTVNFGHTFNVTTSPPSGAQSDFLSVITHELTHGLGVLSLVDANGASSLVAQGCGTCTHTYSVFDSFIQRQTPLHNIVTSGGSGPSFAGTVPDLTSNDLVWNGPQAIAALGSKPGIHAPTTFSSGSSIAHWSNATGGVMQFSIGNGVMRREYSPFEVAALRDLGYSNAGIPVPPAPEIHISGPRMIEIGDTLVLTAYGSAGAYQWSKNGSDLVGETDATLVRTPVIQQDEGVYRVSVETGGKELVVSDPFGVTVLDANSIPVAGALGLFALAGGIAAAGALRLRGRRPAR